MDASPMPGSCITVVSGIPRSGTSLMMQMLQAGGMPVLSDGLRVADEANPRGYLEFDPVKRLRSDRAWLPRASGCAVKIIHLLLRELPQDCSLRYRVIFMRRPLAEIIASQRAMLLRQGKAPADSSILEKAFETQLAELEPWLATRPDVALLRVDYHRVVREPAAVIAELRAFLPDVSLDEEAMLRAVDPGLHRHRSCTYS